MVCCWHTTLARQLQPITMVFEVSFTYFAVLNVAPWQQTCPIWDGSGFGTFTKEIVFLIFDAFCNNYPTLFQGGQPDNHVHFVFKFLAAFFPDVPTSKKKVCHGLPNVHCCFTPWRSMAIFGVEDPPANYTTCRQLCTNQRELQF